MSSDPERARTSTKVLACALCQQKKIKCDRKFPCANCNRANKQCVPLAAPRQRRRRFPERELLDRVRHYEVLLRRNGVPFTPLHPNQTPGELSTSDVEAASLLPSTGSTPTNPVKRSERAQTINLFDAMNQTTIDDEDHTGDGESDDGFIGEQDHVREAVIKRAWDHAQVPDDHNLLLFDSPSTDMDVSSLHPHTSKIFKLWHTYLENVNPLLKVTHTPTMQARIVDAASDIAGITPATEALMFAIYSIATQTLNDEECTEQLGGLNTDILRAYHFGCKQALANSKALRSNNMDSLTALFLYLVSIRPETDPRTLSSMLGIAIRIAQRIGIHDEAINCKCTALESEMRRRLWWALVMFDRRICEMADHKTSTLAPTWDCRVPLNVSDFEIRLEMKTLPKVRDGASDSLFAAVRSEMGDFLRHSAFYIAFTNPCLATLGRDDQGNSPAGDLDALARMIEEKYITFCNEESPLDFMTFWTARSQIAKYRLLEHYHRHASSSAPQTEAQWDTALRYALDVLECDTKLMSSQLIQCFKWYNDFHFPFPAYIHILQDLRKRPIQTHADRAWAIMSDNQEARMKEVDASGRPFFVIFSRLVLQAWEAHEVWSREHNRPSEMTPRIVVFVREGIWRMTSEFRLESANAQQQQGPFSNTAVMDTGREGPDESMSASLSMPVDSSISTDLLSIEGMIQSIGDPQHLVDTSMDDFDWAAFDWAAMYTPGLP